MKKFQILLWLIVGLLHSYSQNCGQYYGFLNNECGRYVGNIGNNHIKMELCEMMAGHQMFENPKLFIEGSYYYVKIGSRITLRSTHYVNNTRSLELVETYNDEITGYFVFPNYTCGQKLVSGTWYSPDKKRKYPVYLTLEE
ncbi:MAG: hypothetical protein NZ455_15385 [Bacteroidia bacterium]|nr:hypothetical protein [Bacteroidia bacterium]